ncbi:hypothetical protein MMC08_008619 [Hypocenomyce scalaris]|nr:hypothetical protein [Hypocenomyce scalaris]
MSQCCVSGFKWDGTPVGRESTLGKNKTYVTGSNKDVAILVVHDVFGWTFPNLRLLADHYAKEADATVYLPDFFDGEIVTPENLSTPGALDLEAFLGRHSKEIRFPEMAECARALKHDHGFKKLGAIGFCYGGWAVFQLGAQGTNLVDCISTGHPSRLTEEEINAVAVPVQILAPETDPQFTPELKAYANEVIPSLNLEYDYQYFPGLRHGFATRCDQNDAKQRKGLERAKNAAVGWFAQILHLH